MSVIFVAVGIAINILLFAVVLPVLIGGCSEWLLSGRHVGCIIYLPLLSLSQRTGSSSLKFCYRPYVLNSLMPLLCLRGCFPLACVLLVLVTVQCRRQIGAQLGGLHLDVCEEVCPYFIATFAVIWIACVQRTRHMISNGVTSSNTLRRVKGLVPIAAHDIWLNIIACVRDECNISKCIGALTALPLAHDCESHPCQT